MSFSGIDKPINNSQMGVSLADMNAEDLRYKLKELIRNALEVTGYTPQPEDAIISTAIEQALLEYRDILVAPVYFPQRRYLATPVCPICSSQMELRVDGKNLTYVCLARNCQHKLPAEIIV